MPKGIRINAWHYALTALLGGAMLASLSLILAHPTVATNEPDPRRIALTTITSGLAMIWAAVFATLGFRRMDEFLQHRSQVAWYWGGLIGIAVSLPIYSFIVAGGLSWLWHPALGLTPYDAAIAAGAFSAGYGLLMFVQLLGFSVAWAWRRIAHQ